MKIRHRIILMVVLTLAAVVGVGAYTLSQSRHNAAQVKSVTEGVVPSAMASADMVSYLKDVQLTTLSLVTAPDTTIATQIKEQLGVQKERLSDALEVQFGKASNDTQQGLVTQARESLANYYESIDQCADLTIAGQRKMAEALLFATVAQYQREMVSIVDTLRVEKVRAKDEAILSMNKTLDETASGIQIVTLSALLLLSATGVMLYRRVVLPIGRMQEAMSDIAGTQDFSRRVRVESKDEIGQSNAAFNVMIAKIEESSSQLREKTNDIQSMLQNLPQGILTVTASQTVHAEYSAHLESILETADIAGRNYAELLFSSTNLGADALAQVEAAVGASVGEDEMNFEFNSHLLVGEVEKAMGDGRVKILELNWSPVSGDHDMVDRLLVCIRDVTELRKLQAETGEQKRELEIIGEILAVTQEKFHEFIAGALRFIDENEQLIRDNASRNLDVIGQLFRNMHTIKGNARTYGLRHLTDLVHTTEQSYDEQRKERPKFAWDQATLLGELTQVRTLVEHYARINEVNLGRKGPGRRGDPERYLLVDRDQIQSTLRQLEHVNVGSLDELVAARDAVHRVLRLIGTEPLEKTLSGVVESIPSLARELGKIPPMITIDDGELYLRTQASATIKNTFMHLLRNSMDHGIETPDERREAGKQPAGTIRVTMSHETGELKLRLSDDGRGLALARIRRIALERGLCAPDASDNDTVAAHYIMLPGFSTASQVTEVSGRGVGMDAVKDFLKRDGGRIEIHLLGGQEGDAFRPFEFVLSLPANYAVHAAASPEDSARDNPQVRSAVA